MLVQYMSYHCNASTLFSWASVFSKALLKVLRVDIWLFGWILLHMFMFRLRFQKLSCHCCVCVYGGGDCKQEHMPHYLYNEMFSQMNVKKMWHCNPVIKILCYSDLLSFGLNVNFMVFGSNVNTGLSVLFYSPNVFFKLISCLKAAWKKN